MAKILLTANVENQNKQKALKKYTPSDKKHLFRFNVFRKFLLY